MDKKRVRPRIRRGQKSAGKTCQSGLILYSCHLLFRSKLLLLRPTESCVLQPSKCRPSLHDCTEADIASGRPSVQPWDSDCLSLILLQTARGCLCCAWRKERLWKQTKQHALNQGTLPSQKQGPSFCHAYVWFTFPLFRGFSKYFTPLECVFPRPQLAP